MDNRTEPGFITFILSAARTGDVSVSPNPCIVSIPKSLNAFATFLSRGDAPEIINLISPPSSFNMSLKIFLLISIPNLSKELLSVKPNFIAFFFPFFSIPACILLNFPVYVLIHHKIHFLLLLIRKAIFRVEPNV